MFSMKWAAMVCGSRRIASAGRTLRRQRRGDDRHPRQFYLATLSQTGWPYIQHRGGPPGFLHLLDDATLAMADFGGNRSTSPPATCAAATGPACF
jgi:predicted pyridoxine 5'-phosphate oxidase superfamily flavin-nucleotide-binding protein